MKESNIKPATPDDAPELARVHVACWREAYAGILPDAMLAALSIEDRAAKWDEILRSSGSHGVYIAECGGVMAGFGSLCKQRDDSLAQQGYDGEISAIYMLQAFQRQGLGAALMRTLADGLIEQGYKAASLWVLRDNPVARRFYEWLGGIVVGEKEDARDDVVLVEVAYGWPDLMTLQS